MDPDTDVEAPLASSWRMDVGAQIKDERQRRGLEVTDIAERLRLRTSFVEALEEGRGNEYMDETYEWSHIKTIASLLDLDLEGRR